MLPEFSHRLVGLDLTDATDSYVMGIAETTRLVRETQRTTLAPSLESREFGSPLTPVGEGVSRTLGGIVVGGCAVLTPPVRQNVALSGPEIEQVEVTGAKVVLLRQLITAIFSLAVLVPVGLYESEKCVGGEA